MSNGAEHIPETAKWLGCTVPPEGWWCSREPGHDGPCAARPATGEPGWGGLREPVTHAERAADYQTLVEVARARYKLACDEMDRLTAGNPGTNWRWSIPANPGRDTDLILSASAEDVPRLADAVEALTAELDVSREARRAERRGLVHRINDYRAERDALRAERDALAAVIEKVREIAQRYSWSGLRFALENANDGPLAAVPSGVLAERDANKWDEGWVDAADGVRRNANPYRKGTHHE